MELESVILEPVVTEKSTKMQEANKYAFKVNKDASKTEIMRAVEKHFAVHVSHCNVMNVPGKKRRTRYVMGYRPSWKKAIVTLKKGEKIDLGQPAPAAT